MEDNLTLDATYAGAADGFAPDYKWSHDQIIDPPLGTGKQLTVNNIASASHGWYYLLATSVCGGNTAWGYVNITQQP